MCTAVRCDRCGKATWVGCGQHIEEALDGFTNEQRCVCASNLSTWLPNQNGAN